MFGMEIANNSLMTWAMRFAGFLIAFIGFGCVTRIFITLGEVCHLCQPLIVFPGLNSFLQNHLSCWLVSGGASNYTKSPSHKGPIAQEHRVYKDSCIKKGKTTNYKMDDRGKECRPPPYHSVYTTYIRPDNTQDSIDQGYATDCTDQGYAKDFTDQGYAKDCIDRGYATDCTDQGYATDFTDQGYAKDCTDQGYAKEFTDQGYTKDTEHIKQEKHSHLYPDLFSYEHLDCSTDKHQPETVEPSCPQEPHYTVYPEPLFPMDSDYYKCPENKFPMNANDHKYPEPSCPMESDIVIPNQSKCQIHNRKDCLMCPD